MTTLVPLIETTRGDTLENRHFGAVAVTDAQGRVLARAGDPHWLTFTRSTLKPFQALPFVRSGGAQRLRLGPPQLALLCASHNGEPMHVEQVDALLRAAGQPRTALQCGCHEPLIADLGPGHRPAPGSWDERHHNCSGKHAGFLCWCAVHGAPAADYLAPSHPLQQAIRADVARVTGAAPEQLRMGIDGCSAPNYAMPLSALARGYARLATGARDAQFGEALAPLAQAMTAHPELVSGTGRNDLAFMQAGRGDWVTKVGADGVQAIGSASRGEAIAIKVADGNKAALFATAVEVLDQLGWLDAAQREALRPWRGEAITSIRGATVGQRRAVFRLEKPD